MTVRNELRWFVQEHRVHVTKVRYDIGASEGVLHVDLHCEGGCGAGMSRAIPIDHPEHADIALQILVWLHDGLIERE